MKNSNLKKTTALLLAATATNPSTAFAPQLSQQRTFTTTTTLHSTTATPEHLYPQLLSSASLCANSDTCSIESAESYLREIIHVQVGCAAGTVAGKDVCTDVGKTSEVVAGLREKIRRGAVEDNAAFWEKRQQEFETLVIASLDTNNGRLSSTASLTQAPLKPAYLALAALYTILIISTVNPTLMDVDALGGVVPFTPQEVWWAIRDGYLSDLTSHLVRNGGLVVGDSTANAAPASSMGSVTPQEVWWSIRDGYAHNTLFSASSSSTVLDGVVLGDDLVGEGGGVVPFRPQEMYWAIRDGYVGDLIGHWFRNGGLSV